MGDRQLLGELLLPADLLLDVHDGHDQVLMVVGPEYRHTRIAAAVPQQQPISHRKAAVLIHGLKHRLFVERVEYPLAVGRVDHGADIALRGAEEIAAGGVDVEFLVRLRRGEFDIGICLGVDVVDHAVLRRETLGDLREDEVLL